MKTILQFTQKSTRYLVFGGLFFLISSCGSYQNASYYDNDGVYTSRTQATEDNSKAKSNQYQEYFSSLNQDDNEIFVDVELSTFMTTIGVMVIGTIIGMEITGEAAIGIGELVGTVGTVQVLVGDITIGMVLTMAGMVGTEIIGDTTMVIIHIIVITMVIMPIGMEEQEVTHTTITTEAEAETPTIRVEVA